MKNQLSALALVGVLLVEASSSNAATAEYTFAYSPVGSQQLILNGTTVVNVFSTGNYDNDGHHDHDNSNYLSGLLVGSVANHEYTASYNDYFAFDLSGVSGPITSAVLSIGQFYSATSHAPIPGQPVSGYVGPTSGLTYTTYGVSTPVSTLVQSQSGTTGIYDDLGSGMSYGSTTVGPVSQMTQVYIVLDSSAVAAIVAAEGADFAIGGSLTLSSVPLPASAPMFSVALLALAGFGYGMNRWVVPKGKGG